jgi:flagellar biosynthesis component FlhA
MTDDLKHLADVLSITTWVSALLGLVPGLTTLAAFIWMCIRIRGGILDNRLKQRQLEQMEKQNDRQSKP